MNRFFILLIFILVSEISNGQNMNNNGQPTTIVFIHGLFMNPKCWELWIKYFEAKGYKCYAQHFHFMKGNLKI